MISKIQLIKLTFAFSLFFNINCLYAQKGQTKNSIKAKIEKEVKKELDSIRSETTVVKYAPIVAFRDTLFYIYGNMGSFTPEQRAAAISERINKMGAEDSFITDSLKIVIDISGTYDLVYKDVIIVGVNEIQAIKQNKSKEETAKEYKKIIINSISKYQLENSWKNLLKQTGLTILILLLEYLVIKIIILGYKKLRLYIISQKDKKIKGISTLIDTDKTISIITSTFNIIKIVIIIISLYLCLSAIFNIFPTTKNISEKLLSYIIEPLNHIKASIINYLPNLFSIIIIFFVFKYIRHFLHSIAIKVKNGSITVKGFYPDWALITYNIVNVILYIFMFIVMFPYLPGSDSPIFQGVSVFFGILFSLGSTSLIGNAVSGIVITYMRSFKIGDRIRIGDQIGNVVEKTPLITRIKTPKNELITIPNSNIMSAQTINYSASAKEYGLILHCKVTFGYEIPWRKVHELLLNAARRTDNIMEEPKPFILQTALNDFYVEYQINVYTKKANEMSNIYSDLNKNIQDICAENDIELLSPHYQAQRDGNSICIPENGLPKKS